MSFAEIDWVQLYFRFRVISGFVGLILVVVCLIILAIFHTWEWLDSRKRARRKGVRR